MPGAFEVPPGNPIEEYLRQREREHDTMSAQLDASGGAKKGLGLAMMLGGGALAPFMPGIGLPAIAGGGITKTLGWIDEYNASNERINSILAQQGGNMWANQFGPATPGQGYPGTQSGRGRGEQMPDWLTGRALTPAYMQAPSGKD